MSTPRRKVRRRLPRARGRHHRWSDAFALHSKDCFGHPPAGGSRTDELSDSTFAVRESLQLEAPNVRERCKTTTSQYAPDLRSSTGHPARGWACSTDETEVAAVSAHVTPVTLEVGTGARRLDATCQPGPSNVPKGSRRHRRSFGAGRRARMKASALGGKVRRAGVKRSSGSAVIRGRRLRENEQRLAEDRLDGSGVHVPLRRKRLQRSSRFGLAKAEGPQTSGGGLEGSQRRRRALSASQVHAARYVRPAEHLLGVEGVVGSAPHSRVACRLRPIARLRADVVEFEVSTRRAAIAVRADVAATLAVARKHLPAHLCRDIPRSRPRRLG